MGYFDAVRLEFAVIKSSHRPGCAAQVGTSAGKHGEGSLGWRDHLGVFTSEQLYVYTCSERLSRVMFGLETRLLVQPRQQGAIGGLLRPACLT